MTLSLVLPAAILVAFAFMLLLPLLEAAAAARRPARFSCPLVNRDVTVLFAERSALGLDSIVDVEACSAFAGQPITCGKACLTLPRESTILAG